MADEKQDEKVIDIEFDGEEQELVGLATNSLELKWQSKLIETLKASLLAAESVNDLMMRDLVTATDALRAAFHALRSYEYGNSATELAKEVADHIEGLLNTPQLRGQEIERIRRQSTVNGERS